MSLALKFSAAVTHVAPIQCVSTSTTHHSVSQGHIKKFCETIRQDTPSAKEDVTVYKAAVWALGHIGSTKRGLELLLNEDIVDDLIELAEECPLLSIRGWDF